LSSGRTVRAALTRKTFLFAGSDAGGERAAIAYTILGSCRLAGVDPREYLADVLPHLTGLIRLVDLPARMPSRWAAARAADTVKPRRLRLPTPATGGGCIQAQPPTS